MDKPRTRFAALSLFAFCLFLACSITGTPVPDASGKVNTIAAETWSVMEAQAALSATATFTYIPITDTPSPTLSPTITNTPTPTNTLIPPLTQAPTSTPTNTFTPTPTATYYYPGPGPIPWPTSGPGPGPIPPGPGSCNKADLVRDITIPDGVVMPPDKSFVKIWRIKNLGNCTWTTKYAFVFYRGDRLKGDSDYLPRQVRPGQSIDIEVKMRTPEQEGTYKGDWLLDSGYETFGSGSNNRPFSVSLDVDKNPDGTIYSFAKGYCTPQWMTGSRNLPCPGNLGSSTGFVLRDNNVTLEDNKIYGLSLWTHPQMIQDGIIYGTFPAILIFNNEQFDAQIGCLHGFNKCKVRFQVYYQVNDGNTKILLDYSQEYDKNVKSISKSLSAFAGNYVTITLRVIGVSRTQQNAAIWVQPRIWQK